MAKVLFDSQPSENSRVAVLLKRAILAFLAVNLVIAMLSGYRAYFQVRSLELSLPERTLHSGSTIEASVVTSGRTFVDVQLEIIQGGHSEPLAAGQVPKNNFASYDPRTQRAALRVALTPELLARFEDGPARVRATATGRAQWLRVPPPEVREIIVEIRRELSSP